MLEQLIGRDGYVVDLAPDPAVVARMHVAVYVLAALDLAEVV